MKSKWGSTLVAISVLVFFTSRLLAETTQTETEKRKSNMAKKIEPLEPANIFDTPEGSSGSIFFAILLFLFSVSV